MLEMGAIINTHHSYLVIWHVNLSGLGQTWVLDSSIPPPPSQLLWMIPNQGKWGLDGYAKFSRVSDIGWLWIAVSPDNNKRINADKESGQDTKNTEQILRVILHQSRMQRGKQARLEILAEMRPWNQLRKTVSGELCNILLSINYLFNFISRTIAV